MLEFELKRFTWRRAILLLWILASLLVLFLRSGDSDSINLAQTLHPPSWSNWMGTDELGRDVATRVVQGSVISMNISLLAWIAALAIGLMAGAWAGYRSPSSWDLLISWLIALAYMTPFMIFLVGILAIIGTGLHKAYILLVLLAWAAPARQTRVAVLNLRKAGFVQAAHSFGYTPRQMILFIMLPQVFRPALIASLAVLPEIIALDAGLSFLGLGAQPPTPTLGKMIADGLGYVSIAWWMTAFPVLILAVICLSIRTLGNRMVAY